jgi:negative regulator of flagellin synthesis FlgM
MSDIAPIGSPQPASLTRTNHVHREAAVATSSRGDDRVELSEVAQLLSRIRELPDVRQDVVDRVRGEIDAGTYETPQKIDAAIEALLEDL